MILLIYWSSIHRPSLQATSWNSPIPGRHWPFYMSSPSAAAVVCIAARRVHSIAFALTVSAPASSPILFSSASHFLKKALRACSVLVRTGNHSTTGCKNVLGFVTRHFLSENPIEEVSEATTVGQHKWRKILELTKPHVLSVILSNFHVYVNRPEVPSLGMRIDDTLKKCLATLRFAQFVLQLCELGDGLEV